MSGSTACSIRFHRAPFETDEAPDPGALIRIFRLRGKIIATVTRYQRIQPDGHERTGYIDQITTESTGADDVLIEFRKHGGQVALESDDCVGRAPCLTASSQAKPCLRPCGSRSLWRGRLVADEATGVVRSVAEREGGTDQRDRNLFKLRPASKM
jgi:hypothetical protein